MQGALLRSSHRRSPVFHDGRTWYHHFFRSYAGLEVLLHFLGCLLGIYSDCHARIHCVLQRRYKCTANTHLLDSKLKRMTLVAEEGSFHLKWKHYTRKHLKSYVIDDLCASKATSETEATGSMEISSDCLEMDDVRSCRVILARSRSIASKSWNVT